jgi:hypothetical protein
MKTLGLILCHVPNGEDALRWRTQNSTEEKSKGGVVAVMESQIVFRCGNRSPWNHRHSQETHDEPVSRAAGSERIDRLNRIDPLSVLPSLFRLGNRGLPLAEVRRSRPRLFAEVLAFAATGIIHRTLPISISRLIWIPRCWILISSLPVSFLIWVWIVRHCYFSPSLGLWHLGR